MAEFPYPIYQVDAFTQRLFGGNYAAVCPLAGWLPDAVLQLIAVENNLPETAFLVPLTGENAHYQLRWFTPTVEVDLCGHATLAAAHVVYDALQFSESVLCFQSLSGILSVQKMAEGYRMDFPTCDYLPAPADEALQRALGVPIEELYYSDDWLVIVENAAMVQAARPDMAYLSQLTARGVIVAAPGDGDVDIVSRAFFPALGIDEDPVTGSAHCLLAPYWAARLGKNRLCAQQGSSRKGQIVCEVLGNRVMLEGAAQTYMQGYYRI